MQVPPATHSHRQGPAFGHARDRAPFGDRLSFGGARALVYPTIWGILRVSTPFWRFSPSGIKSEFQGNAGIIRPKMGFKAGICAVFALIWGKERKVGLSSGDRTPNKWQPWTRVSNLRALRGRHSTLAGPPRRHAPSALRQALHFARAWRRERPARTRRKASEQASEQAARCARQPADDHYQ